MRSALQRPIRFCLVGAAVFALDFFLIWILHRLMPKLLAVSIAYVVAVTVHFCLNRWWVFAAAQDPPARQLARYVPTVAACWACTVGIVWLSLRTLSPNVFLAKALAIPPATLLGFLLMRFFVFRAARPQASA
jgi:putative flippase GtrA